eukprot:CAMPEP_0197464720 /NCGR_PEP_ID=MMETSP1175-20131217/64166_1 /TAXON_ID=1003142 /ORGANISM="Triceratium dubium, Strain CCMP147" /LENGTH=223 /DNA_ID=CAMNT_0043000705 /DNA_START=726 /DNA_END=1397 /DNA_ORIENTATION=-
MTKIVIVATSAFDLKGHPTGLWLEECATPYYKFKEAGYEVVLASPTGGPVPIDASSMGGNHFNDDCKKFMHDKEAMGALSHSVKLDSVDLSSVDAIFFCGGHGTCVDFVEDVSIKSAIETLYESDKVVAAVCHGPNCLPQCTKKDGSPLVKGLKVSAFSDKEEDMAGLGDKCPFLLESKLRELGAEYVEGDPWTSTVSVDGKLVTGQNPQSSAATAEATIKLL